MFSIAHLLLRGVFLPSHCHCHQARPQLHVLFLIYLLCECTARARLKRNRCYETKSQVYTGLIQQQCTPDTALRARGALYK